MQSITKEILSFLSEEQIAFSVNDNSIECGNNYFQIIPLGLKITPDQNTIIIHEDVWRREQDAVKSRMKSILGITKKIHGRNTKVNKIEKGDLINFLEEHHLNVPVNTKYKLGLFHNNNLVAIAAFSKARKYYRNDVIYKSFELVRYCSLSNTTIIGGLSKLIKHFITKHQPDDIVTYIDKEWTQGNSFKKLGFKLIEETSPQTFFVDTDSYKRTYSRENEQQIEVCNQGNLKLMLDLKNE